MDGERFDRLTKHLAAGATRRRVLRGLAGGAAIAVGGAIGRQPAAAAPNACAVGCAGLPGPQKAACKQACKQCGGDINRVCIGFGPVGPSSFTCCPEGTACDQFAGECIEVVTCPTGEPAESCAAGVITDCGDGGTCALVAAAAGGCACVERNCTEVPCATDADCAETGGVCATIPGCCAETTFCAVPCGAGAGARSGGWA